MLRIRLKSVGGIKKITVGDGYLCTFPGLARVMPLGPQGGDGTGGIKPGGGGKVEFGKPPPKLRHDEAP